MQKISLETQERKEGGPKNGIARPQRQLETPAGRDRLLRLILETMPAGLLIQQKPGQIAFVNSRLAEYLGYRTDQLVGRSLDEIVCPEDQYDVRRNAVRAFAGTPSPPQFTFRVFTSDQRLKKLWVRAFHAPWYDCPALIWYIYDINRDRLSETQLPDEENTVSEQKREIQNLNAALKVLMNHHESERNDQTHNLLVSLKKMIFPYLEKIKTGKMDNASRTYLSMIESNLKDLMASLPNAPANQMQDLTYMERQVADLIRHGKTSKEIASMLNVSTAAVSFHRHNLRKKMGLLKRKTTLRSHLQSLK